MLIIIEQFIKGPVWIRARDSGLVYGFSLNLKPNESMMYLTIEGSPDPAKAFKEVVKAVVIFILICEADLSFNECKPPKQLNS